MRMESFHERVMFGMEEYQVTRRCRRFEMAVPLDRDMYSHIFEKNPGFYRETVQKIKGRPQNLPKKYSSVYIHMYKEPSNAMTSINLMSLDDVPGMPNRWLEQQVITDLIPGVAVRYPLEIDPSESQTFKNESMDGKRKSTIAFRAIWKQEREDIKLERQIIELLHFGECMTFEEKLKEQNKLDARQKVLQGVEDAYCNSCSEKYDSPITLVYCWATQTLTVRFDVIVQSREESNRYFY